MLHEYHIIYSVRYYPRFHVTAVGLGMYQPWIRGHNCIVEYYAVSLDKVQTLRWTVVPRYSSLDEHWKHRKWNCLRCGMLNTDQEHK
jgi:ribosomal protein S27AE